MSTLKKQKNLKKNKESFTNKIDVISLYEEEVFLLLFCDFLNFIVEKKAIFTIMSRKIAILNFRRLIVSILI